VSINRSKAMTPVLITQRVVMVALLLFCTYLIVLTVMQFSQTTESKKPVARMPSAKVLYWNWFRGAPAIDVDTEEQLGQLEDAKINAILLGVMIAGDASSATLKFNGKPEAVYHKGDNLGSNTSLLEIEPYRIVVKKNGINKQVLMKKPDAIMTSEESSSNQPAEENGFALANMFGAVPVNIGGNSGLKMNNLSDEIKILADIQEGDVVMQVDGLSIQNLLEDPTKWMSYSGSSSLPVTVIRQGQEEIIYVNAASLSAKMLPKLGLSQ
jgi:type II secretory pathway component PulC|tara:strand:+ start:148 stop:951 length:804 start_codon:yes stop_codon:yes gene_type:complete